MLCHGKRRRHHSRCNDWGRSSGSDQRVALRGGFTSCRIDRVLCVPFINRLSSPVLLFDAAGLGLFCVAGADKALAFHGGPVAATLLGMVTGIGGGMLRDVLVMEVPSVLRTELYAVAALLGAAFTVVGQRLGMPLHWSAPIGAALCITLRLLALRHGWHLPLARSTT
jgi:uncharacterized membrane protein YeiH